MKHVQSIFTLTSIFQNIVHKPSQNRESLCNNLKQRLSILIQFILKLLTQAKKPLQPSVNSLLVLCPQVLKYLRQQIRPLLRLCRPPHILPAHAQHTPRILLHDSLIRAPKQTLHDILSHLPFIFLPNHDVVKPL